MYHTVYDGASSNDSHLRLRGSRQARTTAGRLPGMQERRDPWHYVACKSHETLSPFYQSSRGWRRGTSERVQGRRGITGACESNKRRRRRTRKLTSQLSARTGHWRMRRNASQSDFSAQALPSRCMTLRGPTCGCTFWAILELAGLLRQCFYFQYAPRMLCWLL